jgi:hypothetical protein
LLGEAHGVDCEFDGSGFLEGDVRYRIYLGLDDCTSFDVPGNSSINISLMLTGDGLNAVSWKVNADVSVRDGYFSGEMVKGMHAMDDLYVGEVFLYEVSYSDELISSYQQSASSTAMSIFVIDSA